MTKNKKKILIEFRNKYKGFLALKNNNNLNLWRDIKEQFLRTNPVEVNEKFSKLIFGESLAFGDLIIHQFCADKLLPNWLRGQILIRFGNPSFLIDVPLPKRWQKLLESNDFKINYFFSDLKFWFFVIFSFCNNLKEIFKTLSRSFLLNCKKINTIIFKNSVYFVNLNFNNLPSTSNGIQVNYDIISWYLRSNVRINETQLVYHDVLNVSAFKYHDVSLEFQNLPTHSLNNFKQIFQFFIWLVKAIFISIFDLFRGRWWHSLILGEAAKNKIIEIKNKNELSLAYFFHYSSGSYRPMWTYAAENKGVEIINYFYSTFEQPTVRDIVNNQKFEFFLYNWPKSLVWDEEHSKLLINNSLFKVNPVVVGPIYMVDDEVHFYMDSEKFSIVIFDLPLHKKFFHFGTSSLTDYYENNKNVNLNFIKDIVSIADDLDVLIFHKTKRFIGNRSEKSYDRLLLKLQNNKNYIQVDPQMSPLKIIKKVDMVITFPFSSVAMYASFFNKPTYYYDSSGWIQKDDPASHGVPIIIGAPDLKRVIQENLSKKKINVN